MNFWNLSHMQMIEAKVSLQKHAVLPELSFVCVCVCVRVCVCVSLSLSLSLSHPHTRTVLSS